MATKPPEHRTPLAAGCYRCRGTGWVCETHPRSAYGRGPGHCDCSEGVPCECNPARSAKPLPERSGKPRPR